MAYAPGNLTAVAYDASGAAAARDTRLTSGEATKIELTIDVPSPLTGTGSASPRAAPSFFTVIGCHRLPFLRDLQCNLAVAAAIFCQNDSVAPG